MRIMSELPGLGGDKPVHRIGGSDLFDLFGITPGMLTTLGKRDIVVRLGHDAYDLEESARRYIASLRETASGRGGEEQVLDLTSERARRAREQADAQALKNAVLRGEYVPARDVERAWSETLRALIPPPRLRLSKWIEREIVLPDGVSALPGSVRLWPFQREIADAIGDADIERVTLVKPVRVGFTTLLTSALASFVANEPAPILCLLPAEADCRDYMVSDIEPIFGASPALAAALSDEQDESGRNTPLSRRFPGGSLNVSRRRHRATCAVTTSGFCSWTKPTAWKQPLKVRRSSWPNAAPCLSLTARSFLAAPRFTTKPAMFCAPMPNLTPASKRFRAPNVGP